MSSINIHIIVILIKKYNVGVHVRCQVKCSTCFIVFSESWNDATKQTKLGVCVYVWCVSMCITSYMD